MPETHLASPALQVCVPGVHPDGPTSGLSMAYTYQSVYRDSLSTGDGSHRFDGVGWYTKNQIRQERNYFS